MSERLYFKYRKVKVHDDRPWRVKYDLAYDGGGIAFDQYYRTRFGAKVSAWWQVYVSSWGGSAVLTRQPEGVTMSLDDLYSPNHNPSTCPVCTPQVRQKDSYEVLTETIPSLLNVLVKCPGEGEKITIGTNISLLCNNVLAEIGVMVLHLNDRHKWSREKIADWLDTLDADLRFPIGDPDE